MDRPNPDPPERPGNGSPLLRPARRRTEAPAPRPAPESALGPFSAAARRAASDELPGLGYQAEESSLEDEAEWLELESAGDAPIAEDALEPLAEAAEPGQEPLLGEELIAPPEWEYGYEEAVGSDAPARSAPPAEAARRPSPALEDVAARLEQIARSLRGGSPSDLLSGAADPLQVLIAGYALGLEAGRATQGSPPDEE
jgi:hypothetical protein